MSEGAANGSILVVDDEQSVADVYSLQLETRYGTVYTAYGGENALDVFEEHNDIDVALLDRRMPDMWGDEVLEAVRERGYDCRVIMVTAVDPDFDVLEMPFDDYLQKPIEKDDLFAAVDQQLQAENYDQKLSEYFSITSKIAVLESEKSPAELEENDEYQQLKEQVERFEEELDGSLAAFDDMSQAFGAIDRT